MKNYKAHYSLSLFRPLLWVIAQHPAFFVLEKKKSVIKGVNRELKMFAKCKGEMFLLSPCLKGRGLFIAKKRPYNYQLLSFTNISTKGFS
jgi:hypothetical protein